MTRNEKRIIHLYSRAGFGLTPTQLKAKSSKSFGELINDLFQTSRKHKELAPLEDVRSKHAKVGQLKTLLQVFKSREDQRKLNLHWIERMSTTEAVLNERMTLFWHDHFATNVPFALLLQEQNNTLRLHALGSFRDMLHAIAKDPAMIIYLNNQQNRKKAPNENFAREVMELFTLGEGNGYTENDIQEAARAFTGWHVNNRGEYEFNERAHDEGEKQIFGQTGNWNGDDVIDMLLEKEETANYICRKIYAYFVNKEMDERTIKALAERFRQSDYDIGALMKDIFTSKWFYNEKHIGTKIKSPVELIVGYKRLLNMKPKKDQMLVKIQQTLGQVLFFPPNVAGWKGNRAWIDSSSLLLRMRLPLVVFDQGEELENQRGLSMEERRERRRKRKMVKLRASMDYSDFLEAYAHEDNPLQSILDILIFSDQSRIDMNMLQEAWEQQTTLERKIKEIVPMIMALPEFQLT